MKNLTFLLLFLLPFSLYSQNKFYLDADYAIFRNNESKSTVEVYFSVNQRHLKYIFKDNKFEGLANIEIDIFDKQKSKSIFNDLFGLQSFVNDTNKQKLSNKIIGQQNFALSGGDYIFRLIGFDFNDNTKIDTMVFNVSIPVFDLSKTEISEVQLASSVEKSKDNKSIFYKNGMEITPNPNLLFGMNLNKLYFYFEIYALKKDFNSDSVFLSVVISDLSDKILIQRTKKENSDASGFVEVSSFDIDSLEKGSYLLKVDLIDKIQNRTLHKEKKFFIYNSLQTNFTNLTDDQQFYQSEYANMKEAQCDDDFDKCVYLRNDAETQGYKRLKTLEEKRKFMYNFWKKRDSNPLTLINENKQEYYTKLLTANKLFKQGFMEGWKTDRGRIYIVYGKPNDVESFPYEAETKAYEIWHFDNVEGGTICVFVEQQAGSGYYVLAHSTIRKELRDDNWKDKLTKK